MKRLSVSRRAAGAIAACALAALCTSARATSTPVDYSDTWWNPAENGWGLQFVQNGGNVFMTLYVEDPQTNPIWYTALLTQGADGVWRGDLYITHASWFGGPFTMQGVNRRVGDFAATFSATDRATIAYSVDGVPVAKSIERLPLATESVAGHYTLWLRATTSGCSPGTPAVISASASGSITQAPNALQMSMTLSVLGSPLVCTYSGNYAQSGRYGVSSGAYACAGGDSGTYQLRDVLVTTDVMTGHLTMRGGDGCTSSGAFGGYRE
jgi:hypothetical protein